MDRLIVEVDENRCRDCGFCIQVNICRSPSQCIGCLSCYYACPYEARSKKIKEIKREYAEIWVDGIRYSVPYPSTIKEALMNIGVAFHHPSTGRISAPCSLGGCWACSVLVNGELERTCIMPVEDGMKIDLNIEGKEPLRIIHGPEPHRVGGKATPWWEVGYGYVEAAIWTAGCNLRCPQCQNYTVTYDNSTEPVTPQEAARMVTACSRRYNTRGVAVSGGEPTLNKKWLIRFFKELRRLNPGKRLHLDSNGTILTRDYVDELVESGCNNIGVEPKAFRVETYMKITGLEDYDIAKTYLENSWNILKYIVDEYSGKIYVGAGIAYNKEWMTFKELAEIGDKIASIDPSLQVTVLDYFPFFRRRWLKRPTVEEMLKVKKILEERGLKTVIVQTSIGHLGPADIKPKH
jgi:pyruvate formate lyase activating enzyme